MLDSGIAKMGIFAFILLVAFAGLISIIPAEFANTQEYGNPANKIPETWNGIDIGGYNFTDSWNTTLTNEGADYYPAIGGRNLRVSTRTVYFQPVVRIFSRYGFGLLWEEKLEWWTDENLGGDIYASTLDEVYEDYGELNFECICLGLGYTSSYYKVTSILSFNTTLYNIPSQAWANDDLDILIGINAENTNYQKDIWFLITNLLTFNTLYVFGTTDLYAVILNAILASIIYAPIIIFATAIILEVLPF